MSQKAKRRVKHKLKKTVKKNLQIVTVLFAIIILVVILVSNFWPKKTYATEGVMLSEAMGIPVVQQIIDEGRQNRSGIKREIHWIVIHETDNTSSSADAQHHADYLSNNETDINSWHYTVDEAVIYHSLPDEEVGWHAGDKQTEGGGNMQGIGIEMCVNEGNDFEATLENTAKLVAILLDDYDLSIKDVKKHQDFSGKNCPAHLLEEVEWNAFLQRIEKYLSK